MTQLCRQEIRHALKSLVLFGFDGLGQGRHINLGDFRQVRVAKRGPQVVEYRVVGGQSQQRDNCVLVHGRMNGEGILRNGSDGGPHTVFHGTRDSGLPAVGHARDKRDDRKHQEDHARVLQSRDHFFRWVLGWDAGFVFLLCVLFFFRRHDPLWSGLFVSVPWTRGVLALTAGCRAAGFVEVNSPVGSVFSLRRCV